MKLRKIFFFALIFAAFALCAGCGGGGKKYPDMDGEPTATDDDSENHDESQSGSDEDGGSNDDNTDTVTDDGDTTPDPDGDYDEIKDDKDKDPEKDEDPGEDDTDSGEKNDEEDNDPEVNDDDDDEIDDHELPDIEKDDPAVLCTGQTKCFNTYQETSCLASEQPFYGQDGLYAALGYCLAKSFSTTEDLVTDNITGLVWQRNLPQTYEGCTGNAGALCLYDQALNYCSNLNYGGFSDWRLPAPEEYATIIDYGQVSPSPAIDPDKFPTPMTSQKDFWTSTYSDTTNNKIWYVDFSSGKIQESENVAKYVRCVRGNQPEQSQFSIVNEGGEEEIVYDSEHNLHWTKNHGSTSNWKSALDRCQNLEYSGYDDWRLPSINELVSLIDYSEKKPASRFPGMTSSSFWASTSEQNYAPNAWVVIFSNGKVDTIDKTNNAKVLCVR